ncbi:MAG: hypothetical protein QFX35_02255 [Candidatus Verstraetearchaeota archaeon]|nr:hypothetical protein [Candidatus Verstraetearchaeota archaeon]
MGNRDREDVGRERGEREDGIYCLPVPAGTPYSVIAEAVNTFGVELREREVRVPGIGENEAAPMAWILVGSRESLEKAQEFIVKKMNEMLKRFM